MSFFLPKNKRQNPFAKSNLYIKQFPAEWLRPEIDAFIGKHFGVYGNISSSGVFEDKNIGKLYAFVAFDEQESAQKALAELNEFDIEGYEENLYVAYAQDKATRRRTLKAKHMKFKNETNLYVKSLKTDVTDKALRIAFEKYGKVTSVCIKSHEPKNQATPAPGGTQAPVPEKPAAANTRLRFGFVNFYSADEAKLAFTECKKDPAVLSLLDNSLLGRTNEFVYYAQSKTVRQQYLRMQKKNLKTFKIIQDNVLQYYQLMKYFMPQNFRQNNRNPRMFNQKGRGGTTFRGRGGQQGGGHQGPRSFGQHQGGHQGGRRDHQFPDHNQHQMNQQVATPAPNNNNSVNTPTPSPNLLFDNQGLQQFAQMQPMNNMNIQAFQQQMMNPGQMPGMMNAQNQMMNTGMQQQMQMGSQPSNVPTRDLAWLKANMAEFETLDHHEKKNILGNLMYPLVEKAVSNPEHVPKITGMLIDLEVLKVSEIVEIMENTEALKDRIEEAIGIINETE